MQSLKDLGKSFVARSAQQATKPSESADADDIGVTVHVVIGSELMEFDKNPSVMVADEIRAAVAAAPTVMTVDEVTKVTSLALTNISKRWKTPLDVSLHFQPEHRKVTISVRCHTLVLQRFTPTGAPN